jgi:competence protein ComEC
MGGRSWHLDDRALLAVAAATVLGVWHGVVPVAVLVLGWQLVRRRSSELLVCGVLGLAGTIAGVHNWEHAVARHLGPFEGWSQVIGDPTPAGTGMRVTLRIEGERFDAYLHGSGARRARVVQGGGWAWIRGRRVPLGAAARRSLVRHVVGQFQVRAFGDVVPGSAIDRASNQVRRAVRGSGERTMPAAEAALYSGLVLGDDARQPPWLLDAFRSSGLSHLTAVSGQNVAFTVAAALPLLRRLRPWWRWAATVGLIVWFMALTRFEPSVLRAGVMAALSATGFVLGRSASPVRLLALAVTVLVLADPMLVWSVGFWLSVGATLGVSVVAPWLAERLPGPRWARLAVSVTLGAQMGVALPSLMVFHRLPVVSLPANLAAVPVAGGVMLYGLPAGLAAAALPSWAAHIVMAPAGLGTRWVATVARVGASIEPSGAWAVGWWCLLVGSVATAVVWRSRERGASVPI